MKLNPKDENTAPRSSVSPPKLNTEPATQPITVPGTKPTPPLIRVPGLTVSAPPEIKSLDLSLLPDRGKPGSAPLTTKRNVAYVADHYGYKFRYNRIKKKLEISVPGLVGTQENADNVSMIYVIDLMARHGMSTSHVADFVYAIADENAYCPAADHINSVPWDGVDRLNDFYDTIVVAEDFPEEFKRILLRKFLLSAVAAVLSKRGFRNRGVLTLQGLQGKGKTSWVRSLLKDDMLRDELIKTDHHMDGGDKDSKIGAITNWFVEIGELDSSFKKDVARLKGFLTSDMDKIRRPYGKTECEYPRRTVFIATVNERYFLVDTTGNSRFWTLPVSALNYEHDIDMQQVFAQLAVQFHAGEEWWLTPEEERQLEELNRRHQAVSVIRESLLDIMDLGRVGHPDLKAMTASEILELAGIKPGTNAQARECGSIMRELVGEPKRIQGRDKWRFPEKFDGVDYADDGRPYHPYD